MTPPDTIDGIPYHYAFIDSNVYDGLQYTYSVVAYDIGIPKADTVLINNMLNIQTIEDPGEWSKIGTYPYLENSKGTTVHDVNFITVIPGYTPEEYGALNAIKVVPNPYIVNSSFNETEYLSRIRFTNLPINSLNLSSFGFTATAVSPNIVSGLVVAIVIEFSSPTILYFM